MVDLKMPEINSVIIAGNLTREPLCRRTSAGIPVVNFTLACNKRFRDMNNKWQEHVCYVGVVAWNKLADSCLQWIHKGSAVLVDGELQSYIHKTERGQTKSIVEIKARRIQFLDRRLNNGSKSQEHQHDEDFPIVTDESFEQFQSPEEMTMVEVEHLHNEE